MAVAACIENLQSAAPSSSSLKETPPPGTVCGAFFRFLGLGSVVVVDVTTGGASVVIVACREAHAAAHEAAKGKQGKAHELEFLPRTNH